jgi:hypothetical protein
MQRCSGRRKESKAGEHDQTSNDCLDNRSGGGPLGCFAGRFAGQLAAQRVRRSRRRQPGDSRLRAGEWIFGARWQERPGQRRRLRGDLRIGRTCVDRSEIGRRGRKRRPDEQRRVDRRQAPRWNRRPTGAIDGGAAGGEADKTAHDGLVGKASGEAVDAYSASERGSAARLASEDAGTSVLSGEDLLYILLALVVLAFTGVLTRWLTRTAAGETGRGS